MAYELIYTSVPHGLKLGSSGFCTVAMTNGMPSPLARVMEGMTGYKPLYPMSDSRFANNPPSYFHYSVKVGGSSYDVCGRICSCPIDYTGRTNKIAHFIVPDEMEKQQMPLGAASLSEEMFRTAWAGEPQSIPSRLGVRLASFTMGKAVEWQKATGDAGWAGVLAQSFLNNPRQRVVILFDPEHPVNALQLVREAIQLLPPQRRWEVGYNTCVSNVPSNVVSHWNFCPKNNDFMQAANVMPSQVLLDLTAPAEIAEETPLVQAARSGKVSAVQPPPQAQPRNNPSMAVPVGEGAIGHSPNARQPSISAGVPVDAQRHDRGPVAGLRLAPVPGSVGYPRGGERLVADSNGGKGVRVLCLVLSLLVVLLLSLTLGLGYLYYQTRLDLERYAAQMDNDSQTAADANETKILKQPDESEEPEDKPEVVDSPEEDTGSASEGEHDEQPIAHQEGEGTVVPLGNVGKEAGNGGETLQAKPKANAQATTPDGADGTSLGLLSAGDGPLAGDSEAAQSPAKGEAKASEEDWGERIEKLKKDLKNDFGDLQDFEAVWRLLQWKDDEIQRHFVELIESLSGKYEATKKLLDNVSSDLESKNDELQEQVVKYNLLEQKKNALDQQIRNWHKTWDNPSELQKRINQLNNQQK